MLIGQPKHDHIKLFDQSLSFEELTAAAVITVKHSMRKILRTVGGRSKDCGTQGMVHLVTETQAWTLVTTKKNGVPGVEVKNPDDQGDQVDFSAAGTFKWHAKTASLNKCNDIEETCKTCLAKRFPTSAAWNDLHDESGHIEGTTKEMFQHAFDQLPATELEKSIAEGELCMQQLFDASKPSSAHWGEHCRAHLLLIDLDAESDDKRRIRWAQEQPEKLPETCKRPLKWDTKAAADQKTWK